MISRCSDQSPLSTYSVCPEGQESDFNAMMWVGEFDSNGKIAILLFGISVD